MPKLKRAFPAAAGLSILLVSVLILVLVVAFLAKDDRSHDADRETSAAGPIARSTTSATETATETGTPEATQIRPQAETLQGCLYGRVETRNGVVYEGRLRWGGDEEAFWSDYFNGTKAENPWAVHVPPGELMKRRALEVFGRELAHWRRPKDLSRPFMVRFGNLARIEVDGRRIRATLKSGTFVDLDRLAADDIADGLRIWDARHGVVDLPELRIRRIEFLPTPTLAQAPRRRHGTVHTRQGDFEGFVEWTGTADRRSALVEDARYGRVRVSAEALERLEFSPEENATVTSGPAYDDFPPGHPLTGTVTTRDGRALEGRLVYDLDESETTDTLDAPAAGVHYTLSFGRIASIVLPVGEETGRVTLHGGEELALERKGDLGPQNLGMLVFADDDSPPEHVAWADVDRIDFDIVGGMQRTDARSVP